MASDNMYAKCRNKKITGDIIEVSYFMLPYVLIIITAREHACLYRSYFHLYRDIDFCPKHTMAAQIMFILRSH